MLQMSRVSEGEGQHGSSERLIECLPGWEGAGGGINPNLAFGRGSKRKLVLTHGRRLVCNTHWESAIWEGRSSDEQETSDMRTSHRESLPQSMVEEPTGMEAWSPLTASGGARYVHSILSSRQLDS